MILIAISTATAVSWAKIDATSNGNGVCTVTGSNMDELMKTKCATETTAMMTEGIKALAAPTTAESI